MGLVSNDDDVFSVAEQTRTLFKLLDGRKDDTTSLQVFQFLHEVFPSSCLRQFPLGIQVKTYALGLLPKELLTACELFI